MQCQRCLGKGWTLAGGKLPRTLADMSASAARIPCPACGVKPAEIIDGSPWWHWLYEYDFEGGTYGFSVCARSRDEADARMKRIALARFVGQGAGNPVRLSFTIAALMVIAGAAVAGFAIGKLL